MACQLKPWQPILVAARRIVRQVTDNVWVSAAEQSDSRYGLEAQRDAIRAYCHAAGYELLTTYVDAGLCGTLDAAQRPGLVGELGAVPGGEGRGVRGGVVGV